MATEMVMATDMAMAIEMAMAMPIEMAEATKMVMTNAYNNWNGNWLCQRKRQLQLIGK